MKGKFKGTLIFATAQDANYQIYPIAFAIVDGENDASWGWFFRQMRQVVPDETHVVWVSDRHMSITKGIRDSYQFAKHGRCAYHLFQNVKAYHRAGGLQSLFFLMVNAYTVAEFNAHFDAFKAQSPTGAQYVKMAGFSNCARAFYTANQFNITTTNNTECLNSVFREPRELPVTALIDSIIETLGKWFVERRKLSVKPDQVVSDNVATEIRVNSMQSICLQVTELSEHEFDVRKGVSSWLVNLHEIGRAHV